METSNDVTLFHGGDLGGFGYEDAKWEIEDWQTASWWTSGAKARGTGAQELYARVTEVG